MISIFDYNYTLVSILGQYFYGILPEQTSGVVIQQALVNTLVSSLRDSIRIIDSGQISNLQIFDLYSSTRSIFDFFIWITVHQYLIFLDSLHSLI
jgi:hypothetical protein